jgi:hypothetical protein
MPGVKVAWAEIASGVGPVLEIEWVKRVPVGRDMRGS